MLVVSVMCERCLAAFVYFSINHAGWHFSCWVPDNNRLRRMDGGGRQWR